MPSDEAQFENCLDAIYNTLTDASAWPQALKAVRKYAGAASATLATVSPESNCICGDGLDPALHLEWETYYGQQDPRRTIARNSKPGQWITDDRLLDPRHSPAQEYVNDFALRAGLRWSRGGKILQGHGTFATLALHRPADAKPFDDPRTCQVLNRLLPHMQRVLRLKSDSEKAIVPSTLASAVLDALTHPLIIVTGQCTILYLNQAAEAQLASQKTLAISNGRLWSGNPEIDNTLRQTVSRCCSPKGRVANTIKIPNDAVRWLRVLPITQSANSQLGDLAALITIECGSINSHPRDLQNLFQLTDAEADLLALLCKGHSADECAALRDVKLSTVRSQIAALLGKTGSNSQTRLIALALSVTPLKKPS